MFILPNVVEKDGKYKKIVDLPTKLLEQRSILLQGEIDEDTASSIMMQIFWLNSVNPEEDISIYINSPGGLVTAGMAIYDCMNLVQNKINTICIGEASSMGAFLLSSGTGKRLCTKHSRVMIHQPLGGVSGQASDIAIHAEEILRIKKEMNKIMAENTKGKTELNTIIELTDRDNFMSAEEALDLGLIDEIVEKI